MSYQMPRTRVFDGKSYRLHSDYLKRSNAQWEADKLRQKGWRTRTIKLLGLYVVYKRRVEGKHGQKKKA